ncbi:MAG: hypothetical protein GXO42_02835 [bacterium]|nr:hypothetical protein [bacterium]
MAFPLPRAWQQKKQRALAGLQEALQRGEVDEDILPLLQIINSSENFFTTSSCAGRIMVMEKPPTESKPETRVLGKWHREVTLEEVKQAVSQHSKDYLWFKLDSFILHIVARTLEDAAALLHAVRGAGLRNSGIRAVTASGVLVAITGTENIEHLLGKDGKVCCTEEELGLLVETANRKFRRMRARLKQLEALLQKLL